MTYFIFKPRQSVLITVMCLAGMLNLTGAAAIPIGLLCGPIAVIPAAAGTFVYGMILTLRQNSSVLEASKIDINGKGSLFYKGNWKQ